MKIKKKITDKKQLLEFLEKKGVLITANRRMARSALLSYGKSQVKKGRSAWETPEILTFGAWIEKLALLSLYPEASPGQHPSQGEDRAGDGVKSAPCRAILLSPLQERMIWEEIIAKSTRGNGLLAPSSAAVRATTSWALAHEWKVVLKRGPLWESGDPAAFLNWAGQFDRLCAKNGWIDHARLPMILGKAFKSGYMQAPDAICLFGFDEFTPAQTGLFEILAGRGTNIFIHEPTAHNTRAYRTGFIDATTELFSAARWARAIVESDPNLRVGVIIFDLSARSNEVLRVFEEVCHPDSALLCSGHQDLAFNISYGQSLSDYPLVRAALLILALSADRFSITDWSKLLRSPFIAQASTEIHFRAKMDAYLREHGGNFITISRFLKIFDRDNKCPSGFKNCLKRFSDLVTGLPKRQSPSGWAETFNQMTKAFAWPGDRISDSREYQQAEAWQDALLQLGGLNRVAPAGWTRKKALSAFEKHVSATIFQPEQKDAPIQITGFLEAAGQDFDRVRITGLHHECWPAPAKPDPFLPIGLQREKNLPHSSPAREVSYAKKITERLLVSAPEIIVSYPISDGENELFASPLVAGLPEVDKTNLYDYREFIMPMASSTTDPETDLKLAPEIAPEIAMETIRDAKGPEVTKGQKISGGTGMIKAQAACPFKAFSHYRLSAKRLELPLSGLSPAERGILVHAALEHVWGLLKDQKTLLSMKEEEIGEIVDRGVASAMGDMAKNRPDLFSGRFGKIETLRLKELISECLELEKDRSPFTVIQREERMDAEISGLRLTTIVDRIDRLYDGRLVIIDYKTGQASVNSWTEERMEEPQLPFYSTIMKEPLAGVFFLQVKKGNCKYKGVASDDEVIPGAIVIGGEKDKIFGSYDCLEELVLDWKKRLRNLAAEILSGHAPVAPVDPNRVCRYCDLKPLCRIEAFR